MYESIWQAVKDELSSVRAWDFARRIWEHARWNSFDHMRQTAATTAELLREVGLADVEVIEYPADGVTAYGGWVMPQAWDAEEATLEIVEPQVDRPRLACYTHCPQNLMMYSAPTPPEGVEAEVVAVSQAGKAEAFDGVDVEGKLVLVDGIGVSIGLRAFERGALGVVSDAMSLLGSPQEKTPGHFDHAAQWHNYTVPPWKAERKGFGFSISPANGRRLRELLRTRPSVRLRAVVRTRLYDGVVPAVTGLLPGESAEEIILTGHLFEPGANDNASGCALGIEVARTLAALHGKGTLRRGLRLLFTFEVRGYQAFLASWPHLGRLVAGLNLDMVGNDLSEARARSNLVFNWPALPAYTDVLGLELLRRLGRDDPLFRFRTHAMALVDNLFGEPSVGAPMCVVGNWSDATYHTSLDRIETLSPGQMQHMGRMAATYCAFVANAGFPEANWLAQCVADHAERELLDAARACRESAESATEVRERLEHVAEKNVARLTSLLRLVRGGHVVPTPGSEKKTREAICPWSGLFRDLELGRRLDELKERLLATVRRLERELHADKTYAEQAGFLPEGRQQHPDEPAAAEHRRAHRLVPLRTFKGSLCFESLDPAALAELKERTGLDVGWGAPGWLQLAMFRCNGKRTARDIWLWLERETTPPPLERFSNLIEFLAKHGFIRLRPFLEKQDYLNAFRAVGLPAGATVMVHSSLSRFGYVDGGAEAVIDALLEALGPQGTLAMPTLSFSMLGRVPYDPDRTPSKVGAISEAFRQRPGVLRSPHPTHSVAAFGPNAERIVRDHTPDRPVFGPQSAYARLYDLDAWILMLAPITTNTSLHMAEERAGLLLTSLVAHVIEDGVRREVTLVHLPWHARFDPHYEVLRDRGLLRSAPLGESTIHLMRHRDAIDVARENIQKNPLMVVGDDHDSEFARNLRAAVAARSGEGARGGGRGTGDEG